MGLSQTSPIFFVFLLFIETLFCTRSPNRYNINPEEQTPVLQFGTDNVAHIIANVLHQQRVESLFFQLASNYESQPYGQYGPWTTQEAEISNKFPYLVTPKVKRAIEVDDTDTKVLDGVDARMGEFPYLASLRYKGSHNCGGSIIDAHHILTAAHCVIRDLDPTNHTVVVGEYDLRVKDRYEQTLRVEHICSHRNFDRSAIQTGNDIAIIRLKDRIQFFRGIVERAKLPPRGGEVVDVRRGTADIVGWGNTGTIRGKTQRPNILQTTYVTLYKAKQCIEFEGVRSSIVCAGDDNKVRARDVCRGDSGGPIICSGVVCGLVSYGDACAIDLQSKRGVYTRVHYFREWISNYVLDDDDSQCAVLDE